MKLTSTTILGVAAALALGGSALAHAKLVKSDPPANGTPTDKSNLELTFSEEISGKLSGAVVKDASGKTVASSTMADQGAKGLMVMLKAPLAPGAYTVDWHAVASDDGHKTAGTVPFAVK